MERILVPSAALDLAQIIRRNAQLLRQLSLRISLQAAEICNVASDPTILLTHMQFYCLFFVCLQTLHLPFKIY